MLTDIVRVGIVAGLYPQSPSHFAWQPSARVSQTLQSSYLIHTNAATS